MSKLNHKPITMTPDPLYMTLKNMRQGQHGDRPYAGNLAGHEFVVSKVGVTGYEDYPSIPMTLDGTHDALTQARRRALKDAKAYVNRAAEYVEGDEATLIEIRIVGKLRKQPSIAEAAAPAEMTTVEA